MRRSIWILVFPDFLLLDATGPVQVFSTANDECRDARTAEPYAIDLVSWAGGEVTSSAGVAVMTKRLPSAARLRRATLVVSGGKNMARHLADEKLIRWITRAAGHVQRCASVCSGALLLAQAGLLRQRRAVTHWKDVAELRRHFPDVDVHDDAIYLKDGPIYTSAGITAGIDLCLSLVEEDLGRTAALNVAKRLVVFHKRPGGQRQFSSELLAQSSHRDLTQRLADWLRPRVHETLNIERMSAAMALSSRSLHRRLQSEAGMSPATLLLRIRMEAACRLLEVGSHSIKHVARTAGFGTEYNLRRAFARHLGVRPSEYRERFG